MGFWSFSWKTLKDRGRYFHSRWAGVRPPGPGAGNPAAAACIVATICTSRVAPVGGGLGDPVGLPVLLVLVALMGVLGVVVVMVVLVLLDHLLCLRVELVRPSQIPNVAID